MSVFHSPLITGVTVMAVLAFGTVGHGQDGRGASLPEAADAPRGKQIVFRLPPKVPLPLLEDGVTSRGGRSVIPQAPEPVRFEGLRVQPGPERLRLVFLFDRPIGYTLRMRPEERRARLDLINLQLGYLPAEATRIDDPRLKGLWLTQINQGVATLELRLPREPVRIEHFSLETPAAVVLDLSYDGDAAAHVAARTTFAVEVEATTGGRTIASTHGKEPGAGLPAKWLDSLTTATFSESTVTQAAHPAADGMGLLTTTTAESELTTRSGPALEAEPAGGNDDLQLGPQPEHYDYFPIYAVNMKSPLAEEVFQAFLNRRWLNVIERGVKFLDTQTITEDTAYLLHLIAEARWQISKGSPHPPHRGDMRNMFEQALRVFDGGDLGAFASWRMANLMAETRQPRQALIHLHNAMGSSQPVIRDRAMLLQARISAEIERCDQARTICRQLVEDTDRREIRLQAQLLTGRIQLEAGEFEDAWQTYQQAFEMDGGWINIEPVHCEHMARAALETGRLDEAQHYLKEMINTFRHRPEPERLRWGLLLADVFAAQGKQKLAEDAYHALLQNDSPKGAQIRQLLYRKEPEAALAGEERYCMLLWRRGKIRDAMDELMRSYRKCLEEGIDTSGFGPLAETIVPPFMALAVKKSHPYDAAQAWWIHSPRIRDPQIRLECQVQLVEALDQLGLNEEALRILEFLESHPEAALLPSEAWMRLKRGRLMLKLGQIEEAIEALESIHDLPGNRQILLSTYENLAEAYLDAERPLEAAQAYQTLASLPGADAPMLGEALLKAGHLFLRQGLPGQARDLGLMGLFLEKQLIQERPESLWSPYTGNRLRRMLARAYKNLDDPDHAILMLEDYLVRPGLSESDRAEAKIMLAHCHRRRGRPEQALELFGEVAREESTPQLWRQVAAQAERILAWDTAHPDWRIEPED